MSSSSIKQSGVRDCGTNSEGNTSSNKVIYLNDSGSVMLESNIASRNLMFASSLVDKSIASEIVNPVALIASDSEKLDANNSICEKDLVIESNDTIIAMDNDSKSFLKSKTNMNSEYAISSVDNLIDANGDLINRCE